MITIIITALLMLASFAFGLWVGWRSGWLAGSAESCYQHQKVLSKAVRNSVITLDQGIEINQQQWDKR